MQLSEPYKPRSVRSLDTWELDGWRLKVYGIRYEGDRPDQELVDTARRLSLETLPGPAVAQNRYGYGFVGVHQGRGANFLFFCWWENENELAHRVFTGRGASFRDFSEQASHEVRACTWDIAVMAHERDAWVRHVLNRREGPSLDEYMADRLDAVL